MIIKEESDDLARHLLSNGARSQDKMVEDAQNLKPNEVNSTEEKSLRIEERSR